MPCASSSIWITSCCSPVTAISAPWWPPCRPGRRVSVISTLQTQPPMVADELRRQADQFIDLADLEDQVCRDPASRPVREPRDAAPRGRRPAPAPTSALDFPEEDEDGTP